MDWRRLWPRYWLQNYVTSLAWDRQLNDLLDKHQPVLDFTGYVCTLGEIDVWVSNWPYAYGSRWLGIVGDHPTKALPTVKTRLRLREAIHASLS